ncbi:MAG: hypothetical protein Q4B69_03035 [Slackia sp.]|nr:hypothetical protein [Slackia sp.]
MKICPVCGARCFDDMAVCYGCLHDFSRPPLTYERSACEVVHGEPLLDAEFDVDDIDEAAPREISDKEKRSRTGFDPPWFASSYAAVDRGGFSLCEGGGASLRMAVPMMTIVHPDAALPDSFSDEREASSFVLSIPQGGRVVLCAGR